MKWSWKIGEFAGIGVYIHATFLLIIAWVIFVYWLPTGSLAQALAGVVFTLSIFGCVLLHEFGHALTAKRYGIRTRDITLYPIGGVARLERMPDEPIQELWVALAGPAVNVGIAAVVYVWLNFTGTYQPISAFEILEGSFAQRLMMVNVILVLFNMLPAFPMDGGRVLRAILATRMEYVRATQIAAHIGQGMAFLFGFWGLVANPMMLFVAFFVWIGAAQEANMVQLKNSLGNIPVSRAMITNFETVSSTDTLAYLVDLILKGSQHDFPVVDNGQVSGVVTRSDLINALAAQGERQTVSDIMRRDFQVIESPDMLELAMRKLQSCDCHTLPVLHNGQLVGLVTMDNIGEFLMIQSAIIKAHSK